MPHMGPEELCNTAWALALLHNTDSLLGAQEMGTRSNSSNSDGRHLLTIEAYTLFCDCLARLPTGALSAEQLEVVRSQPNILQ